MCVVIDYQLLKNKFMTCKEKQDTSIQIGKDDVINEIVGDVTLQISTNK